jgi:hypothetical protein
MRRSLNSKQFHKFEHYVFEYHALCMREQELLAELRSIRAQKLEVMALIASINP